MQTVNVETNPQYDVLIQKGILKDCGRYIAKVHDVCTAVVITDSCVDPLYGETVINSLVESGFTTLKYVLPNGERSKNLSCYGEILSFMAENRVTRSDLVVALGGGVIGDMAGFAAATYQRGISMVQLPTTLLAQVDSSVGGKTAVDLPQGKNLVGAFWQPELVLCDTECIATLPEKVKADGMAEAIKYGMIADESMLDLLCNNELSDVIDEVVARCITIKAKFVVNDEYDNGLRQMLNFGHTAGHAIERDSNFSITHGYAVAMGMAIMTRSAVKNGLTLQETYDRLEAALLKHGLPTKCDAAAETLAKEASGDKKRRGDSITVVLPKKVGTCVLKKVAVNELVNIFGEGM